MPVVVEDAAAVVAVAGAVELAQVRLPATQPMLETPRPKPAAAVVVAADSAAVADAAAPRSNPASTPSHSANWPERISLLWASLRKWKWCRSKLRIVKASGHPACSAVSGASRNNFLVPAEVSQWERDGRAPTSVDSTPGYSNFMRLPLNTGKAWALGLNRPLAI
jgi:hypothetical protein